MNRAPYGRIPALRAFYGRGFRLFWAAALLSFGAMQMQQLARGYLASKLTESPFLVTSVFAVGLAPMLIMPFVGGLLADRFDKRRLLFALEVGQIALALAVGLLVAAEGVSIAGLLLLSLGAGVLMGLSVPIRQSAIPDVAEPGTETNALLLYSTIFSLMMIAAPAIGGLLIDLAGREAPFFAACGSSLVSMVFLARMPGIPSKPRGEKAPLARELTEGVRAIRASRPLMLVMISGVIGTVFIVPHMALLPIYQRDILDVGPSGLGLMFAASGVGALVVAFLLALTGSERPSLRLSLLMGAMSGLCIAAFSQSTSFAVALGVLVVVGAFSQGFFTLNMAMVQWLAPPDVMGRVIALRIMVFGMAPAAQILLGAAADLTTPQAALGVMGLLAFAPQFLLMLRPRAAAPT